MRKRAFGAALIATAVATSIAVGAAATQAEEPDGRQVTREYSGPGIVDWPFPVGYGTLQWGGMKIKPRAGETHLTATVADEVHDQMGGYIRQPKSKDGPRVFHEFCGSTDALVRVAPESDVWIYVGTTPCGEAGGLPTRGEVSATLYRK